VDSFILTNALPETLTSDYTQTKPDPNTPDPNTPENNPPNTNTRILTH